MYKWIDPSGKTEEGVGSGVSRDIYSTFWRELFDSYFIGEQERVPFVRHDLYKHEWEAIGMIIVQKECPKLIWFLKKIWLKINLLF